MEVMDSALDRRQFFAALAASALAMGIPLPIGLSKGGVVRIVESPVLHDLGCTFYSLQEAFDMMPTHISSDFVIEISSREPRSAPMTVRHKDCREK